MWIAGQSTPGSQPLLLFITVQGSTTSTAAGHHLQDVRYLGPHYARSWSVMPSAGATTRVCASWTAAGPCAAAIRGSAGRTAAVRRTAPCAPTAAAAGAAAWRATASARRGTGA